MASAREDLWLRNEIAVKSSTFLGGRRYYREELERECNYSVANIL